MFPQTFSAITWLHPKLSPFSGPTAARVSGTTTCFELVRPLAACLAAHCRARTRCVRPTSASQRFDYEHPRLVCYRHFFEAYASPLNQRACTRDQETGGSGISRCPIRFGELPRIDEWRSSSSRFRFSRASDTPVATESPASRFRARPLIQIAKAVLLAPP